MTVSVFWVYTQNNQDGFQPTGEASFISVVRRVFAKRSTYAGGGYISPGA